MIDKLVRIQDDTTQTLQASLVIALSRVIDHQLNQTLLQGDNYAVSGKNEAVDSRRSRQCLLS